jgi:ribosomal protein S27E
VELTTPRQVECPDCGASHIIYPDFDRDPDADLCGSCWLVTHSRATEAVVSAFYAEVAQ